MVLSPESCSESECVGERKREREREREGRRERERRRSTISSKTSGKPQLTFRTCHIPPNQKSRYEVKRLLGRGSYGEVAEAWDQEQNRKVAIKRVVGVFDQFVDTKRIYREMYILRHLAPKEEVISLLDVVFDSDYEEFKDLYLVFEFVDTDLQKLIMSPQYLSTEHIRTFLYQILVGLKFIHSADVIHRDMKPANILLNEDCTLKICDFGLARVVTSERTLNSSVDDDGEKVAGVHDREHPKTGVPLIGDRAEGSHSDAFSVEDAARQLLEVGTRQSDSSATDVSAIRRQPKLKRQLTKHVVTRWYRAPELILLQDYTAAVDVWAVGCIFAELLSMQQASVPNFDDREPLFPGKSCFPLSADVAPSNYGERVDQLHVIFDVIGTPSEEDISSMSEVQQYLSSMRHVDGRDFKTMFPGADAAALDLLESMLMFNPAKRCKVDEALTHPFLTPMRNGQREIVAEEKVDIDMEYRAAAMTREELKRCIWEELKSYRRSEEAAPVGAQPAP
eukprot:scaffold7052_cov254-Pinguiococcus_pyrenoidosus.AAC.70